MLIVFPMAGDLTYDETGYSICKPLIQFASGLLLEEVVQYYQQVAPAKFIFVVKEEDVKTYKLEYVLAQLFEKGSFSIVSVKRETSGSIASTLLAIAGEDRDQPMIVTNYDQWLGVDPKVILDCFQEKGADFGAVSFDSVHPRWSYVRLDGNSRIIEASEKKPISRNALAGLYYFKSVAIFRNAAEEVLLRASAEEDVRYTSSVLNQCVLQGLQGNIFEIDGSLYRNFSEIENLTQARAARFREDYHLLASKYASAFNNKELELIVDMCDEDVTLIDPSRSISGKSELLIFLKDLFEKFDVINFMLLNIYVDGNISILHFDLRLGNHLYRGVDIIKWKNDKIDSIEAYLSEL